MTIKILLDKADERTRKFLMSESFLKFAEKFSESLLNKVKAVRSNVPTAFYFVQFIGKFLATHLQPVSAYLVKRDCKYPL